MKNYQLIGDVESFDESRSYGVILGEYESLDDARKSLKEYRDLPYEEYADCYSHLEIVQLIQE